LFAEHSKPQLLPFGDGQEGPRGRPACCWMGWPDVAPSCARLQVFFYALAFEPTGPVVHALFQLSYAVRNW